MTFTVDVTAVAVGVLLVLAALLVVGVTQSYLERREDEQLRRRWLESRSKDGGIK